MTNEEAWRTLCHPLPPINYKAARRRAMSARIFTILAALAVVSGALVAIHPLYEAWK